MDLGIATTLGVLALPGGTIIAAAALIYKAYKKSHTPSPYAEHAVVFDTQVYTSFPNLLADQASFKETHLDKYGNLPGDIYAHGDMTLTIINLRGQEIAKLYGYDMITQDSVNKWLTGPPTHSREL